MPKESFKKHLKVLLKERDRRYMQMFKADRRAVSAALAAQEKAVSAAFEASEKAIVKAETAQTAYNVRSNEFRATLDDQAKTLLPRTEADARFTQLRDLIDTQSKQIVELQKFESRGEGSSDVEKASKSNAQWLIVLVASILMFVFGGIASLIFFLVTKHP